MPNTAEEITELHKQTLVSYTEHKITSDIDSRIYIKFKQFSDKNTTDIYIEFPSFKKTTDEMADIFALISDLTWKVYKILKTPTDDENTERSNVIRSIKLSKDDNE